ncbi:MAG: LysR family transcriptional regulator [Clostridiaceae bacterium]|nr:LysR family transcriptional regulator [Eubacteriales bacterium]
MTYQSLLYFRTVVEMKNYTRAAEYLHVTQPALSKAIRQLEAELGVALFYKDSRSNSLTECGDAFYRHVACALDSLEEGKKAVRAMSRRKENTVSVWALYSMCTTFLPERILAFKEQHGEAAFHLTYDVTSNIVRSVQDGAAALGICSDFLSEKEEFADVENVLLWKEKLKVIVPQNHPLAGKGCAGVRELKGERFVVYKNNRFGINDSVLQLFEKAGLSRDVVFEGQNDYTVVGLVAAGEGIAVVPESIPIELHGIAVLDFDCGETGGPERSVYLIWNRLTALTAAETRFREFLLRDVANARRYREQAEQTPR